MPAVQLTPNEKEFYRSECVINENNAARAWKKKYADRLESYDGLYKHIPGMQRCIAGIDTQEGLHYIETGGLKSEARPKSIGVQEMSKKSYVNRPKSGAQKIGYGGLGVHSDFIDPPRAADTIYERDYCVKLEDFEPHIRGVNMTKKSVDGPWRRPGDGTMAVIPTKWQFPPGTKQPEGHLVRSELRRLRLEKVEREKLAAEKARGSHSNSNQAQRPLYRNPMLEATCVEPTGLSASQPGPLKVSTLHPESLKRDFIRDQRPSQSRSWAPANNIAPKGWYKSEMGPGKFHANPGRNSILNTPQERLNVLKRRIDLRAEVLASM